MIEGETYAAGVLGEYQALNEQTKAAEKRMKQLKDEIYKLMEDSASLHAGDYTAITQEIERQVLDKSLLIAAVGEEVISRCQRLTKYSTLRVVRG